MPGSTPAAPGDFLAAERTFLAWIRTGLALMGFGFVVARFGLFLRELQFTANLRSSTTNSGLSLWFGTALISLGVVVNLLSLWRHLHLVRELNGGGDSYRRPSRVAIAVAALLAGGGVVLALYLVLVHGVG